MENTELMTYYYRRGNKYFFRRGKVKLDLESDSPDMKAMKRGNFMVTATLINGDKKVL